jgi:hypothetical protein
MRLVLHAGAEFADSGAVHRDLVAHRAALRAVGVMLPRDDDVPSWRETAFGLLRGEPTAMALVAEAREQEAEILLVSSDLLADALASPDEAGRLAVRAANEGLEVRVVVVVREQVGYINSLYCRRILNLDTARGFAEFSALAVPAHRFDYVASFGAIADTTGLDLIALSYPEVRTAGAGRAVVEAAGLSAGVPDFLLPADSAFEPLPGPVLIGATRLLHKRLRRLNSFHEQGKGPLRPLAHKLAVRAHEAGWDDSEYWGWDAPLRRRVMEEYADSNDAFAEFVWGTPWPEPWSTGRARRADLADLDPPVLHDVLTTIDDLVRQADPRPTDPVDV